MSPKNGYRVEIYHGTPADRRIALYLSLFVGGECRSRDLLREWPDPLPVHRGECGRDFWLWQAIAQYLNSGGDPDDIFVEARDALLVGSGAKFENAPAFSLVPLGVPDMYLLNMGLTDEGYMEYLFGSSASTAALLWIEDVHIEMTTLSEIADMLDRAEWDEEDA